ncbi:hypothetical protein [Methanoculleus chikugoensis]|uniref:hypothetical protein n=1 Tax=Methanoculleus chikugoensis TaxID=118126 RepID=UPI0006D0A15C|nr:hypothetical protein [Methanoculleus chikugoensis]
MECDPELSNAAGLACDDRKTGSRSSIVGDKNLRIGFLRVFIQPALVPERVIEIAELSRVGGAIL